MERGCDSDPGLGALVAVVPRPCSHLIPSPEVPDPLCAQSSLFPACSQPGPDVLP